MCCFLAALLFVGPRLAILVWWLFRPLYITAAFGGWIVPLLGLIFLPWTLLMYLIVYPGGVVGFDWIILGLGILGDIAGYSGSYRQRREVPGYRW